MNTKHLKNLGKRIKARKEDTIPSLISSYLKTKDWRNILPLLGYAIEKEKHIKGTSTVDE